MPTFENMNVLCNNTETAMPAANATNTQTPASASIKQGAAKVREFYVFGPDLTGGGGGHGLVFANEKKLLTPPRIIVQPAEGGFPVLHEKPHIIYDPKKGNPPRDLEASLSGYWFISERLKTIFEAVDPDGFAFAECDYTLANGTKGSTHYLCDVVRTIDALDLKNSNVKIIRDTDYKTGEYVGDIYSISGGASLNFLEEVIGDASVFRQSSLGADPICDSSLRDACKAVPDLKGLRFREATRL